MKYFKKADNGLDVEVNKLSTIGNQSLIVKNTGGGNDNDMFISNSGLRKAKFRSTTDNSLGVSTLAPFSVFKVDGGENLVQEPKIVDVSFVSNYDTLEIEGGVIYGSKVKANLIDIHKIIIESEQEIQLTDCIGVWGITGYGTRYDHIGYISDNLEYIDFITPNKIDITKLFLEALLRGIAINPIETCFYLRTSIDDDQTIYEITQTFTGRTPLGDSITVDVNDENITIDYDQLFSEEFTANVSVSDNIATFTDLSKECDIIYDGEITDTLFLGAYIKSDNVIGLFGHINELISSGVITYNDNIITIIEDSLGAPAGTEGFYCIFNLNLSDDGTTPISINLVPTSYVVQQTVINENPYYFETEGEHEVEFEYVNKFYPDLVYPRNNNNYFEDLCIIELNDNFYDYCIVDPITNKYNIEKINLSNNVPENIVEDCISHLNSYSNLKEININTDKYITINNCVIDKTNWSLVDYCGTDVVVPGLVKSIDSDAFFNDSNLKTVVLPNGITTIPIGAFRYCSNLTSITIPDSVTSIGNYAFNNCSNLTSINIPDSVTSIGNYAFQNCSSLTSVNISSLESWLNINFNDSYANPLYYAKNLYLNNELITDLIIPNSVTEIKPFSLINSSLETVQIPNSVISIGSRAFNDCSKLISINIPTSVTSIGNYAFQNCSSLTAITIPDSVTSIESETFGGCSNLTSITIPDSVTSIGNYAFNNCSNLTSINIPDSVTSIGSGAFNNCSNLTSINIPDSVTSIGSGAFDGCSKLTSVTIPDSVTSIGGAAFRYCSCLTSITIPDSVTSIEMQLFEYCSQLTSVNIGNGVTSISSYIFKGCPSLSEITCYAMTAPTISSYTFQYIKTGGVLKVPTGATGYDAWMLTSDYYLGKYGWTIEYI